MSLPNPVEIWKTVKTLVSSRLPGAMIGEDRMIIVRYREVAKSGIGRSQISSKQKQRRSFTVKERRRNGNRQSGEAAF